MFSKGDGSGFGSVVESLRERKNSSNSSSGGGGGGDGGGSAAGGGRQTKNKWMKALKGIKGGSPKDAQAERYEKMGSFSEEIKAVCLSFFLLREKKRIWFGLIKVEPLKITGDKSGLVWVSGPEK